MSKRNSTGMTQQQWREWAKMRPQEGRRLEKLYERQAVAANKMIDERGCSCNPLIWLPSNGDGPTFANPLITHDFSCEENN